MASAQLGVPHIGIGHRSSRYKEPVNPAHTNLSAERYI
ncbi:hypothetical protein appser11_5630 [Actinobacillus pleuropneumoniae serovar 11 str. 56153]|nr:hypothetical protein appser9_5550 [Actinobacillus pleuropneumoniae serovar 9 str. CVJ13261]EFM98972.1 hypothetical protein appser11_5630 [Actinobacillus pleuropneumoniae serovar 11 str. 56153]